MHSIADDKIAANEKKLRKWVLEDREPAMKEHIDAEINKQLAPLVGQVDMIHKAAARSLRATTGSTAYVSNVDPETTLEARKKMVTDALHGTEKKAEKIDCKDGARDFKVHFAKPETLQVFLGMWHEKKYRSAAGAPIFPKKDKDQELRALEAPMVQLTKQLGKHYFTNSEKRKVDDDDDKVMVDKRVVVRLSGGKLQWEDDNLKQLFGDDEDM